MAQNRHSYIAFYPSDWVAGTARMTRLHRSVYFDVCCYNWDKAAACPAPEVVLMLSDLPNWRDLVQDLLDAGKLVRDPDGGLYNPKAMHEAALALDLWQRRSAGGRIGAGKTNRTGTPDGSPDGSPAGTPDGSNRSKTLNPRRNRTAAGTPDGNPDARADGTADGRLAKMAGTPDAELELEPDSVVDDARARDRRLVAVSSTDPIGLADDLCRIAGVRHVEPGRIAQHVKLVREWLQAGATPQQLGEIVRARRDRAVDGVSSLTYFDRAVRQSIAAKEYPDERTGTGSEIRDPLLRRYLESGGAVGQ